MSYSMFSMDTACDLNYEKQCKYAFQNGFGQSKVYPSVVNALLAMNGERMNLGRVVLHTEPGTFPVVVSYAADVPERQVIFLTKEEILGRTYKEYKGSRFSNGKWSKLIVENELSNDSALIAAYLYSFDDVDLEPLANLIESTPQEDLDFSEGTGSFNLLMSTAAECSNKLYMSVMGETYPNVAANGILEDIPKDVKDQFGPGKVPDRIVVAQAANGGDYSLHVALDSPYPVPEVGHGIVLSKETKEIATTVKLLSKDSATVPLNFLMLGEPGSGKTTAAKNVAGLLGIPYATLTCSANMDEDSLFGTLLPVTDDVKDRNGEKVGDLKTLLSEISEEDLAFAPEMVAKKIGAKGDTLKDILSTVLEKAEENGANKEYHYVPSPVVDIYEHGGVLELQEPASVKDVSVLTALYNVLEPGSSMTTPTGRRILRHPNCVVIITSNHEKRELSDAFVSRMFDSYRVDLPDKKVMVERVKKKTGFSDKQLLSQMADVILELHDYRQQNSFSGGSCGMRELENWARKCLIAMQTPGQTLDLTIVKKLGETAVLNKTSQNDEDLEEIRTAIWDTKF